MTTFKSENLDTDHLLGKEKHCSPNESLFVYKWILRFA